MLQIADEEGGEATLWNDDKGSAPALHEMAFERLPFVGRRDYVVESMVSI